MANEKHVELLKSGVEAWNKWREENPDEFPDLSYANLRNADLQGANLSAAKLSEAKLSEVKVSISKHAKKYLRLEDHHGANLDRADLHGADLHGADLSGANLSGAELGGVNLKGADLNQTDPRGAILEGAHLEGADFFEADLSEALLWHGQLKGLHFSWANLSKANLSGSNLSEAQLEKANLSGADLSGADLNGADLNGANLFEADLSGADLRSVRNLKLGTSYVREARFDARSKDPWSVLRRHYTGPRLIFNLLFLIAFLIPYVFKVLFWAGVNRAQAYSEAVIEGQSGIPDLGAEAVRNFTQCLAPQCEPASVWQVILGVDKGWEYWTLAVALITYNLLKAGLTWVVAPMRDEEERSGYTPEWQGKKWWQGYGPLFWIHHYFVRWVLLIAVAAFAYNAWFWLTRTVWIPG